jgi:hypothetical protein
MALTPALVAQPDSEPFEVASIFVELNDTDEDLGLHAEVDGGAWTSLVIRDPENRRLLAIDGKGQLRTQGLTQLAFESAEPSFDELDPVEFFERFPEGPYRIVGRGQEKERFESTASLSHVLAAPVEPTVNGLPAAESCDEPVLPVVAGPVSIDWEPVTSSHPDIGASGPVVISRYQFFLEQDDLKLGVDLPPSVTQIQIPAGLTAAGGVFKYEIIARTSAGNNTAVETCFVVP